MVLPYVNGMWYISNSVWNNNENIMGMFQIELDISVYINLLSDYC